MDILRLFFDCDEFCGVFEPPVRALQLSDGRRHRQRRSTLSASEVMTVVLLFQVSGFRNFKTSSTQHVCQHLRGEFLDLLSYGRFVELQSQLVLPRAAFLHTRFCPCTGISFIDSTPIKVCHNLRIKSNLKPKELHEALQQNRCREKTKEFKEEYSKRAGIEGAISQGVRAFGLRRSRYIGIAKTHLQHLATADAINLERVSDWLAGVDREKTRRS